jgi:hypothetical protein
MNIRLHIEELVLQGFTPADREPIARALREELQTLLLERGLPVQGPEPHDVERVDAGSFPTPAGAAPAAVGSATARALHRSLRW